MFGKILGYYDMMGLAKDYMNGEISLLQGFGDATTDLFSIYGGIFGLSWSIGWEAGKRWGFSKWGIRDSNESRISDQIELYLKKQ